MVMEVVGVHKKPIRHSATLFPKPQCGILPLSYSRVMNNHNHIHSDFSLFPSKSPIASFRNLDDSSSSSSSQFCAGGGVHCRIQGQNPRKKRSKLIRVDPSPAAPPAITSSSGVVKAKPAKKAADPSAPKITRPCSECGKKFWSWKALFGHMRCHPERQWRGINPPPNFRRSEKGQEEAAEMMTMTMTEDDHEVAACLLMLANGATNSHCVMDFEEADGDGVGVGVGVGSLGGGFECSSCKKVFGSHQALGGHRASHKNVKGCFAITKNDGDDDDRERVAFGGGLVGGHDKVAELKDSLVEDNNNNNNNMVMVLGHKCSICLRVFSSGQALGGHKRCHWERVDDPPLPLPLPPPSSSSSLPLGLNHFAPRPGFGFSLDLNLPAPLDDDLHCSHSSTPALDLKLGL